MDTQVEMLLDNILVACPQKIFAKKIKQIISGAAIFTVAPAISIILGMISLSKFLGLPLPWLRLSVLGALTYELTAASTAASVLDIPLDEPIANATAYTTISWVMALGIISGIVVIALFLPKMQKNLIKMKSKDEKWSKLLIDALFMGMISAFLGMIFLSLIIREELIEKYPFIKNIEKYSQNFIIILYAFLPISLFVYANYLNFIK